MTADHWKMGEPGWRKVFLHGQRVISVPSFQRQLVKAQHAYGPSLSCLQQPQPTFKLLGSCACLLHDWYSLVHCSTVPFTSSSTVPHAPVQPCGHTLNKNTSLLTSVTALASPSQPNKFQTHLARKPWSTYQIHCSRNYHTRTAAPTGDKKDIYIYIYIYMITRNMMDNISLLDSLDLLPILT